MLRRIPFAMVCLLLTVHAVAQEPVHPIKKLAMVQADAEIALQAARKSAEASEASFADKREKLDQQPDLVRRVVEDVRQREEAKEDNDRSAIALESCEKESRLIDDLWSSQQAAIREAEHAQQKAQERANQLQEAFNAARNLADQWKDAGLPPDQLTTLFTTLEAEAKKLPADLSNAAAVIDKQADVWTQQMAKTRAALNEDKN